MQDRKRGRKREEKRESMNGRTGEGREGASELSVGCGGEKQNKGNAWKHARVRRGQSCGQSHASLGASVLHNLLHYSVCVCQPVRRLSPYLLARFPSSPSLQYSLSVDLSLPSPPSLLCLSASPTLSHHLPPLSLSSSALSLSRRLPSLSFFSSALSLIFCTLPLSPSHHLPLSLLSSALTSL